jgi:hypothetical protein
MNPKRKESILLTTTSLPVQWEHKSRISERGQMMVHYHLSSLSASHDETKEKVQLTWHLY